RRSTYMRHSNENMFAILEKKLTDEDLNKLSINTVCEIYDRLPEKQGISMLRRLNDNKINELKKVVDKRFQSISEGLEHLKKEEAHVVLNNNGNVVNDGLVMQNGEWIYFHNTNDKGSIYKMLSDGEELQRVNYFESFYINVAGKFIYYSNGNDSCKIYRIQTDGMNNTRLNNDLSCYINVSGDWIYYSNRSDRYKLYKMKTDGSHRQKINDDGSREISVINNWIYYQNYRDGDKIYRIRLDGTIIKMEMTIIQYIK
ncbi:MAG: serine/threonine protein kinase, partial [Clostridia bacterium]|nr:serine/threonine protein kinase [Clostridia bacterium]